MKYLPFLLLLLAAMPVVAQQKNPVKKPVVKTQLTVDSSGYLSVKVIMKGTAVPYNSLELVVTQPEKKWVGKYNLDSKGQFKIKLPVGTYHILLNPKQGTLTEGEMKQAVVELNKTTTLNFEYRN